MNYEEIKKGEFWLMSPDVGILCWYAEEIEDKKCWICEKENFEGFIVNYPESTRPEEIICVDCLKKELEQKKTILDCYSQDKRRKCK